MGFFSQFRTIPPVTLVLIALNIIAFCAFNLGLYPNGAIVYNEWVLSPGALLHGDWYTLITSMFLHGSIMHITCNMFSLYYLGVMCEKVYGKIRYLVIYFVSGIAGGLLYCAVNYMAGDVTASAVGASGAIFGLFGAYGWLLIAQRKVATVFVSPTSKADMQAYGAMLILNLAVGFSPGSNIANEAHIGGMIAGFIVGMLFYVGLKPVRMAKRGAQTAGHAVMGSHPQQQRMQQPQQRQAQQYRQTQHPQQQYNPSDYQSQQQWHIQQGYPQQQTRQQHQPQPQHQQQVPPNPFEDEKQAGQYNPYRK